MERRCRTFHLLSAWPAQSMKRRQATGIGRTKLYEEISAGRIESVTIGKRRLVLVPSLLRLLASEGTPNSAPHAPEAA